MRTIFSVAWHQLSHQKMKLVAAVAGVVVAVMLMLVQLGIRQGAMDNSVAFARRITADLVVVSPRTKTIFHSAQFPRRLLYRLPAHASVAEVQEVYMGAARWKNPWEHVEHPISVYGVDPEQTLLRLPGFAENASELRLADRVVFDGLSRTNYGPVVAKLQEQGEVDAEVNARSMHVVGSIDVGVSIGNDGNLYMDRSNFLRLFPERPAGAVDLGLIRLSGERPVGEIRAELEPLLGKEARIWTRDELIAAEIAFLRANAPVDFIFGMGAAVGFFIGFVVVYQILYTEVTNHLPQFATLKAIGFTDFYLLRLVLWQSVILSVLGYIPGFFIALALYDVATQQIQMPFSMTVTRAVGVFLATLLMCCLSAAIAIRKVRTADPADVF